MYKYSCICICNVHTEVKHVHIHVYDSKFTCKKYSACVDDGPGMNAYVHVLQKGNGTYIHTIYMYMVKSHT